MDFSKPVEIADEVFWVGHVIPDDPFQCHVYLIRNGQESILIDPGSEKVLAEVLDKIFQLTPLKNIKYIIMHHQDPDITGCFSTLEKLFPAGERYIVTHWRTKVLLEHYNWKTPFYLVDTNNWKLLAGDRELEFIFTPYAHFPGAICTFDKKTKTLFSSDIFGSISSKFFFFAEDNEDYYKGVEFFHKHYMPSKYILQYALNQIMEKEPVLIAPQHGSLLRKDMIKKVVDRLKHLNCGLYLLEAAKENSDLNKLVKIEAWIKKLFDIVIFGSSFENILKAVYRGLKEEFPEMEKVTVSGYCDGQELLFSVGIGKHNSFRVKEDLVYKGAKIGKLEIEFSSELDDEQKYVLHLLVSQIRNALSVSLKRELDFIRLEKKAETDPLTGLYNKEYLLSFIKQLISRNKDFSVAFIDLDKFKVINDTYGHLTGDCVLKEIARNLKRKFRSSDCISRFGGEEFVVVAVDMDGKLLCQKINSIREEIASKKICNLNVTFSAGVTSFRIEDTLDSVLERADSLLYRAKEEGRNRVVCDSQQD